LPLQIPEVTQKVQELRQLLQGVDVNGKQHHKRSVRGRDTVLTSAYQPYTSCDFECVPTVVTVDLFADQVLLVCEWGRFPASSRAFLFYCY
jgi:hypothetical protein